MNGRGRNVPKATSSPNGNDMDLGHRSLRSTSVEHVREGQSTDDPTARGQQTRPISPISLAQTRGKVAELRGMVSTLVDKSLDQEIAYRTIASRLQQAEKELAEHRANDRDRAANRSDQLIEHRFLKMMEPSISQNFRAQDRHDTQGKAGRKPSNRIQPTEA